MRAVHDILIVRNNSMLARYIKPDVHLNVRDIESIHKAKEYAEIRLYFIGSRELELSLWVSRPLLKTATSRGQVTMSVCSSD